MEFILASGSPRRRELLCRILPEFCVQVSAADERYQAKSPQDLVTTLALRKVESIDAQNAVVISADTTVALGGACLGKPRDRAEAFTMLQSLQGRTHMVYTGVAIRCTKTEQTLSFAEQTKVHMAKMTNAEIEAYLNTGDYMDKAGAYGIQGPMAKHISGIQGCYYNVMGLPVHALYEALKSIIAEEVLLNL